MKVIGFNHFQLDSYDVERSRVFYEALGGKVTLKMERENGWVGYHVTLAPETVIEIQPPRLPRELGGTDGWNHLAIYVEGLDEICSIWEDIGGTIERAQMEKTLGPMSIKNAVVFGPEGEKIELIQIIDGEKTNTMKIVGNCHMQIDSSDLERTLSFYQSAFGGKVAFNKRNEKNEISAYYFEIVPGTIVEIQKSKSGMTGKPSAWNTIAIETDNIDELIQSIVDAGGKLEAGPFDNKLGDRKMISAVVIGIDDEHIELLEF